MKETTLVFFLIQFFSNAALFGILWFIQLVHYPLFKKVKEHFCSYEKEHVQRSTYLLTPLIVLDVFTNVVLVIILSRKPEALLVGFALAFNIMTWLSTFSFQIDQHKVLYSGFSRKVINELIKTSWIRTLFWTCKTGLICLLIFKMFH